MYGKFEGEETEMMISVSAPGKHKLKQEWNINVYPWSWPKGARRSVGLADGESAWPRWRAVPRYLAASAVSTVGGAAPYRAPFPSKSHKKTRTRILMATSLVTEKLKATQISINGRLGEVRCIHRMIRYTSLKQMNLKLCCEFISIKNNVERTEQIS